MSEDLTPYLQPNRYVDSDNPGVVAFAHRAGKGLTPREVAVSLYFEVRDGWRYTPYHVGLARSDYQASLLLDRTEARGGHCIDKALLLAAAARVHGIPSRLHYADVRNHIGTERLEQQLGTDRLVYHGYTELWLDGDGQGPRWVAATPAFNKGLCDMLGVAPLDFDGVHDSVFQAFDRQENAFMEYLADHGTDPGVPFEPMMAAWRAAYRSFAELGQWPQPGGASRNPDSMLDLSDGLG